MLLSVIERHTNSPQQKKEMGFNLHLLLKGLHKEFQEKDRKLWINEQRTLDRGGGKKKQKKNWMCLMKMLHHVCLIPFCIIDMNYWYDSCKVFFKQLNNLLLSMLPQRVPDLDKKLNSPLFFFSSGLSTGHRPFACEPPYEETFSCVVDQDEETGPLLYWSWCGWPHKRKCNHTRVKTRKSLSSSL